MRVDVPNCKYLGDENECFLPRNCACPSQDVDPNPDGSVNLFICKKGAARSSVDEFLP